MRTIPPERPLLVRSLSLAVNQKDIIAIHKELG